MGASRPAARLLGEDRSRRRVYALSGVGFVLAFAAQAILTQLVGTNEPFYPLFTLAVILSAWYGGLSPALVVAALSALASGITIARGCHSVTLIPLAVEFARLAAFGAVVVLLSVLATGRRRAADALRASEDRSRALINASSDVFYRMNADWSAMLEWKGGTFLIGTATTTLDWVGRYIHPEDQSQVRDAIGHAVRTGHVFALEHRLRRTDGTWGWTASRAVPVRNASGEIVEWFGAATDITERKRNEDALRTREADLARAQAAAHLGSWRWDLTNDRVTWSDELYRIFGTDPQAFVPSNAAANQMLHPDDRARHAEMAAMALDGQRVPPFEARIIRPSGEARVVQASGFEAEFDATGKPLFIFGTILDITERKRADERRQAEERLNAANLYLKETDRRKDEFIAILSHELRNPLAPIRYALPLIQREKLVPPASLAVAVIERQVDHLTRLVDDLLDVSRITRGKIELRREHVLLASIVNAATEAAAPTITAAGHALEVNLPDDPIWLDADAARITQVLTNLLNNSAKYTPRGGRIVLDVRREGEQAVIEVRDNGMGIPPEALPTVFEMFRQVNRPDKSQGGLGIGLALVQMLVEMHGGTIAAHSGGAGQGSEFTVRLPVADEGKPQGTPQVEISGLPSGGNLKVLVVDDNADLVEMLAMVVEGLGYDVRKALDGEAAIAAAKDYRPDVVLLDLGLPVVDGFEVARQIRQRPETRHAHLVALTGWGQAEDRARTRDAGFDHHLTKPTDPGTLQRLLCEVAKQAC